MRFSFYLPKKTYLKSFLKEQLSIKIPLKTMSLPFYIDVELFHEKTITLSYKKNQKIFDQIKFNYVSVKNIKIKHKNHILAQTNFDLVGNNFLISEERINGKVLFNDCFSEPVFYLGVKLINGEIVFESLKFFPNEKKLDFVVETINKEPLFSWIKEITFCNKIYEIQKIADDKIFFNYIQ